MSLQGRDKENIWHPLTQHQIARDPLAIVRAKGVLLWDDKGNSYIDAISSWYTAVYGHCHPEIIGAAARQLQELDQVVFAGFTHKPAVELSEKLLGILPENQSKIFFNDNGSTAVEAAIKMALQYHHNRAERRNTIIAFENGFHGDTFGAMSASGLSVYNGPFEDYFLNVLRIPVPQTYNSVEVFDLMKQSIEENQVAAFVYEPLVQGAAGMKFHDGAGLDQLLRLCRKHDVITIADEVMTGFGKTGTCFASLQLTEYPDIICLSKALTAGTVPMGITSCAGHVFEAFLDEEIQKGFFHAHTYSANPLGCAVAIAGIELLCSEEMQENIQRMSQSHQEFVHRLKGRTGLKDIRSIGVILALDLDLETDRYGDIRDRLYEFFMERGIYLRPLGNTVYIVPPYVTSNDELNKIYTALEEGLKIFV